MKVVRIPRRVLVFALLAAGGAAGAQTVSGGAAVIDQFQQTERAMATRAQQSPPAPGPALEAVVSADEYVVGPSDVLAVGIWTSPPVLHQLVVTPEGTLLIPSVGEIPVADRLLADVKRSVGAAVGRLYTSGSPTVTLVNPRSVVVTVTGNVLHPGSYTLSATSRIDKAIERANALRQGEDPAMLEAVQSTMSARNIRVSRRKGGIVPVDLVRFAATKEPAWNPYLREGDVVVVPRFDARRNVVAVYGEVNVPGRYEHVDGDRVSDLLAIAHGFTPRALVDSLELGTLSADGEQLTTKFLGAVDGPGAGSGAVALNPGDRLIVRARPDLRGDFHVVVEGEVRFPGVYPITRSRTRLSDVLRAAGGVTPTASLHTAHVLRRSVQQNEIELERIESLRGGVPPEDSLYYHLETDLRIRKEIVNVDFHRLLVGGDSTQDIFLLEYDRIVVPHRQTTIYVFGQVASPGHVPFVSGEDAGYYVRQAGGITARAREGDLRIVKAKTRQWLEPGETTIEEGDYVWVPKDPERPFGYYLNIVAQSAAILSVGISLVLLVNQLDK